ncbi:MAG TPA: DUF6356 family protein [Stellaceae bacterium]|nr:DUF6356 family protein [Stellaceae bacterium]
MKRLSFTEHPASVGENYLEHLRHAAGFAGNMISGGLACLVHAILPFLFTKTGSGVVATLHTRMIDHRRPLGAKRRGARTTKRITAA